MPTTLRLPLSAANKRSRLSGVCQHERSGLDSVSSAHSAGSDNGSTISGRFRATVMRPCRAVIDSLGGGPGHSRRTSRLSFFSAMSGSSAPISYDNLLPDSSQSLKSLLPQHREASQEAIDVDDSTSSASSSGDSFFSGDSDEFVVSAALEDRVIGTFWVPSLDNSRGSSTKRQHLELNFASSPLQAATRNKSMDTEEKATDRRRRNSIAGGECYSSRPGLVRQPRPSPATRAVTPRPLRATGGGKTNSFKEEASTKESPAPHADGTLMMITCPAEGVGNRSAAATSPAPKVGKNFIGHYGQEQYAKDAACGLAHVH